MLNRSTTVHFSTQPPLLAICCYVPFSSQINYKMGASRETCDLFWILRLAKKYPDNKQYYYKRFWYVIRHERKLMFEDTFLPFWCKIVGHKKYIPNSNEPKEIACKRCHKWVS